MVQSRAATTTNSQIHLVLFIANDSFAMQFNMRFACKSNRRLQWFMQSYTLLFSGSIFTLFLSHWYLNS